MPPTNQEHFDDALVLLHTTIDTKSMYAVNIAFVSHYIKNAPANWPERFNVLYASDALLHS